MPGAGGSTVYDINITCFPSAWYSDPTIHSRPNRLQFSVLFSIPFAFLGVYWTLYLTRRLFQIQNALCMTYLVPERFPVRTRTPLPRSQNPASTPSSSGKIGLGHRL